MSPFHLHERGSEIQNKIWILNMVLWADASEMYLAKIYTKVCDIEQAVTVRLNQHMKIPTASINVSFPLHRHCLPPC